MKLAACFIQWCFYALLVNAQPGDVRIDEDKNYFEHQDIEKALKNKDRKSWMYYRTYSRKTGSTEHSCVYAEVAENQPQDNVYEFKQGYNVGEEVKEETLFASPFKTEHTDRKTNNAMRVTKRKGDPNGQNYRLIYSDYKDCDILRVMGTETNYGYECELYLHDNAVDREVPKQCMWVYGNACGKNHQSFKRQVYNESCKKRADEPLQTTPATPSKPEEVPEETTAETQSMDDKTSTSTAAPGC
uniref:Putative lipocalin-2 1 n=1 Tax=Ixodes ricinus TaxID=34613 RepID=V5HXL7_IXORI